MPTLIDHGRVVPDTWNLVDEVPDSNVPTRTIVPATYAIHHAETLFAPSREIGVWMAGDAEPDELVGLVAQIALIAIRFPALNDGRGLSLAVLLRTRFGFTGELRAIGEVHEDVLHYMHRCGIDSYQLPDGHDPQVALAALSSLSAFYQGSVIDPQPAFRRVKRG